MVWTTMFDQDPRQFQISSIPPLHVPPYQLVASAAENSLDHKCALDFKSRASNVRLTGIICTIDHTVRDVHMLEKLMQSGMNIARLNCSHGSQDYNSETLDNIRKAVSSYSSKIGMAYPLAVALDTRGPEIRTGLIEGGSSAEIELKKGDSIKLTTDKAYAQKGNKDVVYVDYDNIQKTIQIGDRLWVDNGLISLICQSIQGSLMTCVVELGGFLGSRKTVNLPGIPVDLPAVCEQDVLDLKFAVEHGVDMIFASFVRDAAGVHEIRDHLGEGSGIMVISKIESQTGVEHFDEIVEASDAIIVARGDLGIEIPTQKLFVSQKSMIGKCNKMGKPVIVATHMLHSMIEKPKPTPAEVGDMANAVMDGADCLLLSEEIVKGKHPLECIRTMANVCKEAESAVWTRQTFLDLSGGDSRVPMAPADAVAISAVEASIKCVAAAIVVISRTGKSACLVSKYRPKCPVIVVTRNLRVARQCHLWRGLLPLFFDGDVDSANWANDVENRIKMGIDFGKSRGFIKRNDPVVVLTGYKSGPGCTNTMRMLFAS